MDNLFTIFLRTVLIFAVIGFVFFLASKEKPADNPGLIKLPRVFLIVGIIVTIFFLFIIIGAFFLAESRYLPLAFLPFLSLGLIIILYSCNWKICINGDEAIYRNIIRLRYVFKAEEVESLRVTKNVIRLRVKGKTFWIDPYALNLRSLGDFLRKNPNLRKAVHQAKW